MFSNLHLNDCSYFVQIGGSCNRGVMKLSALFFYSDQSNCQPNSWFSCLTSHSTKILLKALKVVYDFNQTLVWGIMMARKEPQLFDLVNEELFQQVFVKNSTCRSTAEDKSRSVWPWNFLTGDSSTLLKLRTQRGNEKVLLKMALTFTWEFRGRKQIVAEVHLYFHGNKGGITQLTT